MKIGCVYRSWVNRNEATTAYLAWRAIQAIVAEGGWGGHAMGSEIGPQGSQGQADHNSVHNSVIPRRSSQSQRVLPSLHLLLSLPFQIYQPSLSPALQSPTPFSASSPFSYAPLNQLWRLQWLNTQREWLSHALLQVKATEPTFLRSFSHIDRWLFVLNKSSQKTTHTRWIQAVPNPHYTEHHQPPRRSKRGVEK